MSNLYGFSGKLQPASLFEKIEESWTTEDIAFNVKDGEFKISYDDPTKQSLAEQLAKHFIQAFSLNKNTKVTIDFNHTWKPSNTGRQFAISFQEKLELAYQIKHTVHSECGAKITGTDNNISLKSNEKIVTKMLQDPVLAEAILHFTSEVVDDKRPLYGIYKSIEVITKHMDKHEGRKKLALLAEKPEQFVQDLMETANSQRHPTIKAQSKKVLSEQECQFRARLLIQAYMDSL